jgi:hypothetical protein
MLPNADRYSEGGPGVGLPRTFKYKVWGLVILIVFCGCMVSLFRDDWMWLARFGAIIVILTTVMASFNTYVESKVDITLLSDYIDKSEEIYQRMKDKPHLYGISRPLTEEQARELISRERDRINNVAQASLEREFSDDLKKMEWRIGSIGTLLWGFADLLNMIHHH